MSFLPLASTFLSMPPHRESRFPYSFCSSSGSVPEFTSQGRKALMPLDSIDGMIFLGSPSESHMKSRYPSRFWCWISSR